MTVRVPILQSIIYQSPFNKTESADDVPHDLSVEVATLKVNCRGGGQSQTIPEGEDGDGDRKQTGKNKSNVGHSVASCNKNIIC
jgi:hypothetical protein